VIVTDEVRAYAIFIYEWMGWTTHTEVRRLHCMWFQKLFIGENVALAAESYGTT
jgi:hypothetical protein